jgi:hypothetical protein
MKPKTPRLNNTERRETEVEVFHSLLDENRAECKRRAKMTPEERWMEFVTLQKRAWGEDWHLQPIVKQATWEELLKARK